MFTMIMLLGDFVPLIFVDLYTYDLVAGALKQKRLCHKIS